MDRQMMSPLGLAPAVLGFMMVHATLRRDAAALVAASECGSWPELEGRTALFARVLSVHHQGEDDVLLPALRARQPDFSVCSTLIEQQHVALDRAVQDLGCAVGRGDVTESAGLAFDARRLLEDHLVTEERELLPVWQASFSLADHEEFAGRLRRSTRLRDIGVMVPWLLEATPDEFRDFALAQVPAPTRVVHRLWWRRRFRRTFAFAA